MGCGSSTTSTNPIRNDPAISIDQGEISGNLNRTSSPLKKLTKFKYGKQITQFELEQLRTDFWSSRVEGDGNMWLSLRNAADAILANDLSLANAILEASTIITPTGTLEIAYDERGFEYKIPLFCLSEPIELNSNNTPTKASPVAPRPGSSTTITLHLRINPGDLNLSLQAKLSETILDLKRNVFQHSQENSTTLPICEEARQRILFMGKELKDEQILRDIGVDDKRVVQIFLRPQK